MNKSELKNGLVSKLSSGFKYLVIDGNITNFSKVINLNNYNENLKDVSGNNHGDIIEVYEIKKVCCLENILNDENLELLWKREEEIDWEDVPKGTMILVRDFNQDEWEEREFITYAPKLNRKFIAYDKDNEFAYGWKYAKQRRRFK